MPEWVTIDNIINVLVIVSAVYIFLWMKGVVPILRATRDDYKAALDAKEKLHEIYIDIFKKESQDKKEALMNIACEAMDDITQTLLPELLVAKGWDYTKKTIIENLEHEGIRNYLVNLIEKGKKKFEGKKL